jgi:SAM-dependent methyltransferase
VLDVGSADGPSVSWMSGGHDRVALDVDPRGLVAGSGVCGSALALPFADRTFNVVGAFDVLEHCAPEQRAVAELFRVLEPGGRLLASVPAYTWAWTDHDVRAGHHRRYTRTRLVRALELGGFDVLRATYGFAAVFPVFAAERLARRARERRGTAPPLRGLPRVSPGADRLLTGVCRAEARVLRGRDLPDGSSVFVAARRPGQ